MNYQLTLRVLGGLLLFLAAVLVVPFLVALLYQDGCIFTFLSCALGTAIVGIYMFRINATSEEITHREGFAIVTFGWIIYSAFGGLPYWVAGITHGPVDSFFEAMSGFTTTGATVLVGLDTMPESILLWRSLTQWLGGMGIIVLSLAILPFLGVGGMQLYEAEVPGPTADRLTPRVQDTAKLLYIVYIGLTIAQILLLWLFGFGPMNFFESVCHSLTTMATGGFSTRDASVAGFDSSYCHWIITIFMFIAGINFALHYVVFAERSIAPLRKSTEVFAYTAIIAVATLLLAILNFEAYGWNIATNLRDSAFQCVSIITTTGYATANYEVWPVLSQYIIVALMWLGGCAGSTGGGMKIIRVVILCRYVHIQLLKLIHPREIIAFKLDGKTVPADVVQSVLGFVALYALVFLLSSLAIAGLIPPAETDTGTTESSLVTSGAAVITCLSNVGPGLGDVGPTENFKDLHSLTKIILSLCMLIGRLEIFTVLVLFFPSFWRQ